jgi:hypothetical protein
MSIPSLSSLQKCIPEILLDIQSQQDSGPKFVIFEDVIIFQKKLELACFIDRGNDEGDIGERSGLIDLLPVSDSPEAS